MTELESLRISVARIAQVLEMNVEAIPGNPCSYAYEDLAKAAKTERGWNNLAAQIAVLVENLYSR
jgi:hypothetical protein